MYPHARINATVPYSRPVVIAQQKPMCCQTLIDDVSKLVPTVIMQVWRSCGGDGGHGKVMPNCALTFMCLDLLVLPLPVRLAIYAKHAQRVLTDTLLPYCGVHGTNTALDLLVVW